MLARCSMLLLYNLKSCCTFSGLGHGEKEREGGTAGTQVVNTRCSTGSSLAERETGRGRGKSGREGDGEGAREREVPFSR